MTRLVVILLLSVSGCMADPECGPNENLVSCPVECASDYCPRSEEESLQSCPSEPEPCPPKACKCRINYRYASPTNRTCIPTRSCPPFECSQSNQEFNACPPFCPSDTCSQATPDGSCPKLLGHIGILLICSPKCRCIKGYWKQNGVCIPYPDCPQNLNSGSKSLPGDPTYTTGEASNTAVADASAESSTCETAADAKSDTETESNADATAESSEECDPSQDYPTCGPNEEYLLEKPSCPGERCFVITAARIDCKKAPPPQPGCACISGYYRINETSPCVDICQCPQMAYSDLCVNGAF